MAFFRLIPKEEKFYADFVALAVELKRGASLLEDMLASLNAAATARETAATRRTGKVQETADQSPVL